MKVDNFTLEQWTCPAKYDLRMRQHLVPLRRKPSLSFGGVLHEALAEWYRSGDKAKSFQMIEDHWPEVMPSEDFRTKAYAHKVLAAYMLEYPEETWKVLQGAEGPIVEQAFTVDTGLKTEDGETILYGGIIDVGCQFGDMLYVVDHKTTTVLGDGNYYFQQYNPDNQMTGYIWGLRQLTNQRVGGAIVNAIGIYKSGDVRFKRQITTRNDYQIAEWLEGVRLKCNEIRRAEKSGIFRLETTQCTNYGLCDYHSIHVLNDPVARQKRLEQDYIKSEWNYEARDD